MLLAPEGVGDIPVIRPALAWRAGTPLDVMRVPLLDVAVAPDIGAHRRTCDRATRRRDVLAASAASLVTEVTADDCADNGARKTVSA
jgi:hypothetical protein